ncbi:Rha family transcriptional regulator [Lysobacter sp. Root96]|uniref:carph-isopro domain-containing protein n=1 Tax=Lysobacter sp. Root96 TaxID=1736612 RepID=UPI0006FC31FC|nr:Rha family transcriptional regulator [Lysobacter sp. Root96]KRD71416.1 Rha family transcriptional regulator [Lysobacter sp. Root96]
MDANQIIDALGGTAEVARLCNVKPPSVSEWRRNGIPDARVQYLRLLRPDAFDAETANDPAPDQKAA